MNDLMLVGVRDRVDNLHLIVNRRLDGQRTHSLKDRRERQALHVFHHDEGLVAQAADSMDAANRRMAQRRC